MGERGGYLGDLSRAHRCWRVRGEGTWVIQADHTEQKLALAPGSYWVGEDHLYLLLSDSILIGYQLFL